MALVMASWPSHRDCPKEAFLYVDLASLAIFTCLASLPTAICLLSYVPWRTMPWVVLKRQCLAALAAIPKGR